MQPNYKSLLIKSKSMGVDPLVDLVLSDENTREKLLYQHCLSINRSTLKRTYVEACLLASTDLDRISRILEIEAEILQFYKEVFYDTSGLDKLSRMELLDVKDPNEHLLKMWALSQGLDFIAWRLGDRTVSINPIEGLKELFTIAMYKAKESAFSGNASEVSKEGVKWTKMATDLARLLKNYLLDTDSARKDIELALMEVDTNFKGFGDLT